MSNVIVFGPHPDDQEIGMGGTIAKLAHLGHQVLIVDVTDGSPTPRGDRSSRLIEAQAALQALQPKDESNKIHRLLLNLPNRMVEHTLATRHALAGAIRLAQAQIIFTPWPEDAHPDHRAVTRNVEDARFDAKLTKLDMPLPTMYLDGQPIDPTHAQTIARPIYPKWLFYYHASHLRAPFVPSFVMDITGFEQQKLASIRAYRSQFGPWTSEELATFSAGDPKAGQAGRLVTPDLPERLLTLNAYTGSLIGTAYGEGFISKEPLGLSTLSALLM